jgi:tetratricopeptide (TPR) repeat protein
MSEPVTPTEAVTAQPPAPAPAAAAPPRVPRWHFPRLTPARAVALLVVVAGLGLGGYFLARHLRIERDLKAAHKEMDRQRYNKARGYLNLVLQARPDDVEARLMAARANRMLGAFTEAKLQVEACRKLPDPDGRIQLERDLYAAQMDEEFLLWERKLAGRVQDGDPNSEEILEVLVAQSARFERIPTGMTYVDQLLELNPNHLYGLLWKGQFYGRVHDEASAKEPLQQALTLDPEFLPARRALAALLLESNNPTATKEQCLLLLQQEPDDLEAMQLLAISYRKLGTPKEAVPLLKKILHFRPNDRGAIMDLALDQFQMAPAAEETERQLRDARKLAPNDREVLFSLSKCLRARNQGLDTTLTATAAGAGGAIALATCNENTEQGVIDRRLADLELLHNKYQVAERKVYKEVKTPADAIRLRLEAARIANEAGRDTDVLKWLNQAQTIQPNNREVLQFLADFYESRGDLLVYHYYMRQLGKR